MDGCIVSARQSFSVADIRRNTYGWITSKWLNDFTAYLYSKGLNASIFNNDVLIDNKKVASCTAYQIGPEYRMVYSGFQYSINQDLETIKYACVNQPEKTPGSLSDYGITTEEIYTWSSAWFNALEPILS